MTTVWFGTTFVKVPVHAAKRQQRIIRGHFKMPVWVELQQGGKTCHVVVNDGSGSVHSFPQLRTRKTFSPVSSGGRGRHVLHRPD